MLDTTSITLAVAQGRFNMLPLRPEPLPLESLTSYLNRVARDNGIRSVSVLASFVFPGLNQEVVARLADSPLLPPFLAALARAVAYPEPLLQATTFYHQGEKFGRSSKPGPVSRFLSGSISLGLRYCPRCVEEHGYYSLTWRFLMLQGCVEHRCVLLDKCGGCGRDVPLFKAPLGIGTCPYPDCGQALYACTAPELSEYELTMAASRMADLQFLLTPTPGSPPDVGNDAIPFVGAQVGQVLATRRRARGILRMQAAELLGVSRHQLSSLELSRDGVGSNFDLYVCYAEFLGLTLRDLFTPACDLDTDAPPVLRRRPSKPEHAPPDVASQIAGRAQYGRARRVQQSTADRKVPIRKIHRVSEEYLVAKIGWAVTELREKEQPVSQRAIADLLGIKMTYLRYYPVVREHLDKIAAVYRQELKHRHPAREAQILDRVDAAVRHLEQSGKPVTVLAIGELVGMSKTGMRYYPLVREALEDAVGSMDAGARAVRDERERALVSKAEKALWRLRQRGERVTQDAVAELVGMSTTSLRKYGKVRALLEALADENLLPPVESEILLKVEQAINALRARGKVVSPSAVAHELGISYSKLRGYTGVRAFLARAYRENPTVIPEGEKLISLVEQAIQDIENRGELVKLNTVARDTGVSVNILSRSVELSHLLDVKRWRAEYEVRLAERVQNAQLLLRQQGRPVTQLAIGEIVGVTVTALRRYLGVRDLLDQTATNNKGSAARAQRHAQAEARYSEMVAQAIGQLEAEGKPVTQAAIGALLSISPSGLRRYSKVRKLFEKKVPRLWGRTRVKSQRTVAPIRKSAEAVQQTDVARNEWVWQPKE